MNACRAQYEMHGREGDIRQVYRRGPRASISRSRLTSCVSELLPAHAKPTLYIPPSHNEFYSLCINVLYLSAGGAMPKTGRKRIEDRRSPSARPHGDAPPSLQYIVVVGRWTTPFPLSFQPPPSPPSRTPDTPKVQSPPSVEHPPKTFSRAMMSVVKRKASGSLDAPTLAARRRREDYSQGFDSYGPGPVAPLRAPTYYDGLTPVVFVSANGAREHCSLDMRGTASLLERLISNVQPQVDVPSLAGILEQLTLAGNAPDGQDLPPPTLISIRPGDQRLVRAPPSGRECVIIPLPVDDRFLALMMKNLCVGGVMTARGLSLLDSNVHLRLVLLRYNQVFDSQQEFLDWGKRNPVAFCAVFLREGCRLGIKDALFVWLKYGYGRIKDADRFHLQDTSRPLHIRPEEFDAMKTFAKTCGERLTRLFVVKPFCAPAGWMDVTKLKVFPCSKCTNVERSERRMPLRWFSQYVFDLRYHLNRHPSSFLVYDQYIARRPLQHAEAQCQACIMKKRVAITRFQHRLAAEIETVVSSVEFPLCS